MSLPLLALVLASSFPLPTVDGKSLSVTEAQKSFRLPIRFEKVRSFYEQQFKGNASVKLKVEGPPGERKLSITNAARADSWTRAKASEKETETVVEVTPVMRMTGETVEGNGKPLVEFVFSRSGEVDKALKSIDHTDDMRAR